MADSTEHKARLSYPLALKFSAANTAGEFSGLGSTFNGPVDSYGDIVGVGAFTKSIAEHRAAGTAPALLWHHDPTEPIGILTQLVEEQAGLRVDGKLTLEVERARDAHALMKAGALGLSIGYRATHTTPLGKGQRRLDEIKLFEISAVCLPANSAARITSVKSRPNIAELNNPRVVEKILRDAGFSKSQSREIVFLAKAAFRPLDVAIADQKLARKLIAAAAAINNSFS